MNATTHSSSSTAPRQVELHSTDPRLPLHERLRVVPGTRPVLQEGQVRVGMLAMTINPADLLQIDGRYGTRPPLPFVPGHEGVGVVLETGPGVADLPPGTHVLPLGLQGYWADERVTARRQLVPLPAGLDPLQAAMLAANPATAWVLLRHLRSLAPGDWVVQNAANSAVGQCVRQLAKPLGLRVLNVVRRPDAVVAGSDPDQPWIVDAGPGDGSFAQRVAELTGRAPITLALDAVGGDASGRLAACLAEQGLLVVYGLMSGLPCAVPAEALVFRGITVRGFWLASWFADAANRSLARNLYPELVALLQSGALHIPVEASHPLEQVHAALAHAGRAQRAGKVLLTGRHAGMPGQPG